MVGAGIRTGPGSEGQAPETSLRDREACTAAAGHRPVQRCEWKWVQREQIKTNEHIINTYTNKHKMISCVEGQCDIKNTTFNNFLSLDFKLKISTD